MYIYMHMYLCVYINKVVELAQQIGINRDKLSWPVIDEAHRPWHEVTAVCTMFSLASLHCVSTPISRRFSFHIDIRVGQCLLFYTIRRNASYVVQCIYMLLCKSYNSRQSEVDYLLTHFQQFVSHLRIVDAIMLGHFTN